jgi:hypothetical protein
VGVDKEVADEADRLYRSEVIHGRWAQARDSIRNIITEMFQHICSCLQDSPSASVEDESTENEDSIGLSPSSMNNVIAGATVNNVSSSPKLIDAVRSQLKSGDLDTFPKFEKHFKTWIERDINNFEHWPVTIEQDYVDPMSGLTSKSLAWLEARLGRITGSNSYELLGEGFGSVQNAVKDFVFGNNYESKSNFAKGLMLWGTYCEDTARNVLEHQLRRIFPNDQVSIKQAGIYVLPSDCMFGFSPDGYLMVNEKQVAGVEIKCPSHENYRLRKPELRGTPLYSRTEYPDGNSGCCPIKYWLQMQLGMYVMQVHQFVFFVWTPNETYMEWIKIAPDYINKLMIPALREVYKTKIRPLLYDTLATTTARDRQRHWPLVDN